MLTFPFKIKPLSRPISYGEEYAIAYWKRRTKTEKDDTAFFHNLIKKYEISLEGKTILDLAAGPGFDLKILSSFKPKRLLWHDKMEGPYLVAKKMIGNLSEVEFNKNDIINLKKYQKESIDFALCRESLYYVGNDYYFFRELKRILKPGGFFWFCNIDRSSCYEKEKKVLLMRCFLNKIFWQIYLFTGIRILAFSSVSLSRLFFVFNKLGYQVLFAKREKGMIECLLRKK